MDIVVVGSCMTDLFSYVPRLPLCGETIRGDRFAIGFGGKGANQCVAAARLGARTALVAKLGEDTFGENYLKNLKENNVNIDHVTKTKESSTGVASISVASSGENSIVIVSGANLKLSIADVMRAEPLIASAKVLTCQLEICPEVTLAALRLARKHNVKTILNTAPALESLSAELYTYADVLCANEVEAELLTGHAVDSERGAAAALGALLARGCGAVLITLGAGGTKLVTRHQPEDVLHIPADVVSAVDSTGAGDAFVGALAYYTAVQPSMPLATMVCRAGQIATITVLRPGTQMSYPTRQELDPTLFTSQ